MGFVYVSKQNSGEVPEGGTFPLGTVVRRAGCGCDLSGDGVVCQGTGWFEVTGTLTVSQTDTSGSTAPVLAAAVMQDGKPVMGGAAAASSAGTATLPLHCIVRNDCCASSTVTVQNAGPAVEAGNLALTVRKMA